MKVFVDGDDFAEVLEERQPQLAVIGAPQKTRENVARWLARYAEYQDCDVELVYENQPSDEVLPPVEKHGRVRMKNLTAGEECLHEIAGSANRAAENDRVYVVTEDPRLAEAVDAGNARVYSPEKFASRAERVMGEEQKERFAEPDEKYSGVSDEQVDFWVEFFDEKD